MNIHWAPQSFLLAIDNVKYDFLGRFEFFSESIKYLTDKTSLEVFGGVGRIGRQHATNASALVAEYYTPLIAKRVQEIYHDDFLYLGYGWSI